MKIYEIPGKLVCEWHEDIKAMFDVWADYNVTVDEFRKAILTDGLNYAKTHGGKAWIMDASSARNAFSADVMKLINEEVLPSFAKAGIKYFVTVKSMSAVTNMSIKGYSAIMGPLGIQLLDVPDQDTAIAWLKANG